MVGSRVNYCRVRYTYAKFIAEPKLVAVVVQKLEYLGAAQVGLGAVGQLVIRIAHDFLRCVSSAEKKHTYKLLELIKKLGRARDKLSFIIYS